MQQDTNRNILNVIQDCAHEGKVGVYTVSKVNMAMLVLENGSKTRRWLLDAATGAVFEHSTSDILEQVRRTLVEPIHQTVQIEYMAINTQSKWKEVAYLTLPLSVTGVSQYRGQLTASKLDFHDKAVDSPLSPSEIIGLGAIPGDVAPRLWNCTGSVPNQNGGEFDRVVSLEHCTFEFSSTSGQYLMTKLPACVQFEAPLAGLERSDIDVGVLLDGLQAAPEVVADEAFAKQLMAVTLKR